MRISTTASSRSPEGLAQAFLLGRDFLAGSPACLVLGDNILHGHGLSGLLQTLRRARARARRSSATGSATRSATGWSSSTTTAGPSASRRSRSSRRATTPCPGLYFYGPDVCDARGDACEPSARGELEITDLNRLYLERGDLQVEVLGRGFAWLDAGTHRSLIEASNFIQAIEERQGLKIGCLRGDRVAQRLDHDPSGSRREAEAAGSSSYGAYLRRPSSTRRRSVGGAD